MSMRVLSLSVAALLFGALAIAQETKKEFAAKCLVAGKPDAKEDKNAEYKGAKVYFCCDNCKGKFNEDKAKFAIPANIQLVSTKQFVQKKCPISGADVAADQSSEVAGVKVSFCCEKCKGKVDAAEGDAKKELVFKDAAFDKAFEIAKKK